MLLVIALAQLASASSLDIVEVAGPWGSPNATDATAMWWNPAGLASGKGTRFHLEGAPLFATIHYDRDDPNYGGRDTLGEFSVVPFAGIATDFGVEGLGFGASLTVPFARAGSQREPIPFVRDYSGPIPFDGASGRYHTREARVQVIQALIGGGYDFGMVSVGAGAGLMMSSWQATLDNSLIVDFSDKIAEISNRPDYTDAMIEDPRYSVTTRFGTLRDTVFSFNAGLQIEPIQDRLSIGIAYHHSANVDHTGDVTLHFGCPPEDDGVGRFGSQTLDLCRTDISAAGRVAYSLPSRLYGGIKLSPTDALDLELMGGLVTWSRFSDFDITISDVEGRNKPGNFRNLENTAEVVNQERLWARDNHNTGWIALDGKFNIDEWTVGARVTYDGRAVPDETLLLNNYDTQQIILSALGGYELTQNLSVGLTYSQYLLVPRTISNSAFGMTLDPEARNEDRYFYPQGNGRYSGSIGRVGVSLRGRFGNRE